MDRGIPGDSEEEKGPCRETGDRCARDVEREGILRELSPDALDALSLFRAAGDQFIQGFDGPVALDYRAVEVVARWKRIEVTPDVFELLRIAKDEALKVFKEWRDAKKEGGGDDS